MFPGLEHVLTFAKDGRTALQHWQRGRIVLSAFLLSPPQPQQVSVAPSTVVTIPTGEAGKGEYEAGSEFPSYGRFPG